MKERLPQLQTLICLFGIIVYVGFNFQLLSRVGPFQRKITPPSVHDNRSDWPPSSQPVVVVVDEPAPDLCLILTFPKTNDHLKQLAHINTAGVYAALRPRVRAFLVADAKEETNEAWAHGLTWLNDTLETNVHGTPTLGSLLRMVRDACPETALVGYVNSDILFDARLLTTLDALRAWDPPELLAVGRRNNHDLTNALTLDNVTHAPGELFITAAQDYFILTRALVDPLCRELPAYVIGRIGYDNAVVDWAFHRNSSGLVDLTSTVTALHQTTSDGNNAGHSTANPDVYYNIHLPGATYDHGLTSHAPYETVERPEGVVVVRRADGLVMTPRPNSTAKSYELQLTRGRQPFVEVMVAAFRLENETNETVGSVWMSPTTSPATGA
jgi:hypothetical protein